MTTCGYRISLRRNIIRRAGRVSFELQPTVSSAHSQDSDEGKVDEMASKRRSTPTTPSGEPKSALVSILRRGGETSLKSSSASLKPLSEERSFGESHCMSSLCLATVHGSPCLTASIASTNVHGLASGPPVL